MKGKEQSKRFEIRLAGEGGQGMILAGVILAEAAAIYEGKYVVQTQSYGPEARGGASKAEVVISDEPIDYPEVLSADVLVAMSQEACDRYASNLKKEGLLIVDVEKVKRVPLTTAVKIPITRAAIEASGKAITANVVALGVLVGLTGVVSREAIEKAILARAPKGSEEMNCKALARGFAEAEALLAVKQKAQKGLAIGIWDTG
ncbi:MAG: 2-oxoacid:acceptor oxidoreductase family protein [Anaerolineales bacterium]|nr:2-oxoacid:acceptor oxidoreductase family protein [Anaerolineales bacterium]MDW8445721.1 2-oxoacid:acceptor oxidoreductase family protein [Anaerolineales bacterium]